MLSSFAYGRFREYLVSRGHRGGVEVVGVNPAFSSVIGRVKFMERYGLTVHQAAALVLARRIPGCSERIPRRWVCPDGMGGHVAFVVPERKRVKHVWTYWRAISRQLGPALGARRRPGRRRRGPDPAGAEPSGFGPGEEPVRRARVRIPGGSRPGCWGDGAAWTASGRGGRMSGD